MVQNLAKLYQFRELLWIWIQREIRIRYKQSFLGAAWAVLQPLSMMLVFTTVFSVLARLPSDGIPYPVFSYSALLPWTFFVTSVNFGSNSLITNLNLVTKTYFPREILPIGSIGAGFFDYLIAAIIFLALLLFYRMPLNWTVLWLPVILGTQILLTLGVTLLTSALTVFYRDVRFLVPLGLQIWMFATPIIYPASLVPDRFRAIYMLNPMAGIIDSYRKVFLYGTNPTWSYFGVSLLVAVGIYLGGYTVFKKLEKTFPDLI
jgi:lipopolysaccharide transport system permease protein